MEAVYGYRSQVWWRRLFTAVVLIGLAFADAPTHFLAINRDSSSRSK